MSQALFRSPGSRALGLPAIDDSGGSGLYFGGGLPAGFAWAVTNTAPRVNSFYVGSSSPEFEIVKEPGPAQGDTPGWLSPEQQKPYEGMTTVQPVLAEGMPLSEFLKLPLTEQLAAQTAGVAPKQATTDYSSLLLIGGGLLLAIMLLKK